MRMIMLAFAALMSTATLAETPAPPPIPASYGAPIRLADAQALVQRAVDLAKARGHKMAIAVVEPSGELVAFARMEDTPYGSITLAQQKARTSARFRMATATAEGRVMAGRLTLLSADDFVAIGGGVPIVVDGRVVGALGVSGASAAEDAALAAEAVTMH